MIPRPYYTGKIMSYVDTPFVKILTGVRRSGKSTILKMLMGELKQGGVPGDRILHYNFDSLEHEEIKTAKALFAMNSNNVFFRMERAIYSWTKFRK